MLLPATSMLVLLTAAVINVLLLTAMPSAVGCIACCLHGGPSVTNVQYTSIPLAGAMWTVHAAGLCACACGLLLLTYAAALVAQQHAVSLLRVMVVVFLEVGGVSDRAAEQCKACMM